jgi:hypothetical protein
MKYLNLKADSQEEVDVVESALQTLGITEAEWERVLRLRGLTKLEQQMELVKEIDPSFPSFVSRLSAEWANYRNLAKASWKQESPKSILKKIRQLVARDLEEDDVWLLCIYAYLYRRLTG